MPYLAIVTLIWSFSFSLIGVYLSQQVDTWFSVLMRIGLAFLLFLPLLRFQLFSWRQKLLLMAIGASQLGLMYVFYYHAFLYISVPEVVLFTIMTPIYITLLYDLLRKQRLRWCYLLTAGLSVLGAAIIRYEHISQSFIIGFLLVQGANFTFALGQVTYKVLMTSKSVPHRYAFAWVYCGAFIVALICWFSYGNPQQLPVSATQWLVLFWLGLVASGLCYFLWNLGATKVDAGTLAIMNNVLIPLGILVNVLLWRTAIDWPRFLVGSVVIALALWIHQRFVIQRA